MNSGYNVKSNLIYALKEQGLILPYSEDYDIYHTSLSLYGKRLPNRVGIQPLEGFDSDINGGPTDMVYRRYLRFVKGGAGLIWFEACAVSDDGKSNPYQMSLNDDNVSDFQKLIKEMDKTALEASREPAFKVLQLTHSGRMSKDKEWNPIPLAARKNKEEENIPDEKITYLASDDRIRQMVREHIHAAELAAEAGFDAVDVKVCHGYFLSELLSAYGRPGCYGGSFENRTRALFEIIDGIKASAGEQIGITVRLNAFDSEPYPYGYAIKEENGRLQADLNETVKICKLLKESDVELIDISASSPSVNLFGSDPANINYRKYTSAINMLTAVKSLKQAVPEVIFMCTGLSDFKELGANIGASGIKDGWFDIAGFGRQALAYPDFANDILNGSGMDENKCCTGCNNCFKLMDGHTMTGCIVRDKEIYLPLYKKHVLKN